MLVVVRTAEKRLAYAIRANLLNQSESAVLLFEQFFEAPSQGIEHVIEVILLVLRQATHNKFQRNLLLLTQKSPQVKVV